MLFRGLEGSSHIAGGAIKTGCKGDYKIYLKAYIYRSARYGCVGRLHVTGLGGVPASAAGEDCLTDAAAPAAEGDVDC